MPSAKSVAVAGTEVQETQFTAIPDGDEPRSEDVQSATSPLDNHGQIKHSSVHHGYDTRSGTANSTANGTPPGSGLVEASSKASASPRALSPDLLRGLLMVLQAIDHCSVSQGAWRHGVALESEADGTIVNTWNAPVPWIARMLTHLCAPGFMFLLGMGIVYFGRSRGKLGWSPWQMLRHFAVRAFVLAAINEVWFTLLLGRGRLFVLNIILLALAVNYLIAGLVWLATNSSEKALSRLLETYHPPPDDEDDAERPLLQNELGQSSIKWISMGATRWSWHIHNAVLLALAIITIAWNSWLSPHHGHCPLVTPPNFTGPTQPRSTTLGPWFDFWFLSVQYQRVISPFPPLAWLSPAILGLLYGRVTLSRQWQAYTINAGNALFGVLLMMLFVLTRLLHFGNLSEDCLRMPEQLVSPGKNQYLVSLRSILYISKYPPSFAYMTLTMSVNFLLLAFFGALPEKVARPIPTLLTFGQSALFFYVFHLMLYFCMSILVKHWFGRELDHTDPMTGKPAIGTEGQPAVIWITWLIGLAVLWPLCRWYAKFKSTKNANSVWRFF
ncbi:MAG: hypothetical protein Q9183_003816 [Haloplaca sp. 2 TL-2023]